MNRLHRVPTFHASRALSAVAALFLLLSGLASSSALGQPMAAQLQKLKALAPARGYVIAHKDVKNPPKLFGGPITVTVTQKSGGVFVALPDRRRLDTYVFGTPSMPRAFAGTPGINGVPPMAREKEDDHYTRMKMPSPFGDKYVVMADGQMELHAVDATAVDGATTEDQVRFKASWKDDKGNTYEVRCCGMLAAHGMEFPTFGGVVTNHILHGVTRLGTALMPTEFVYVAFWGMGEVRKNGEVLDKPRLIHGMLTEYVRGEGYKLAFDDEVTPTRMQFHLMIPPFMPDPPNLSFTQKPVKTGMTLPNGMELPFWHVMFENLETKAERGQ